MYLTFIYLKVYETDWKNLVLYFLWSEDSSGHYKDSVFLNNCALRDWSIQLDFFVLVFM